MLFPLHLPSRAHRVAPRLLKSASYAHSFLCLINVLQAMIILIPQPQPSLPGFCSSRFSASTAITCQQLCFEFLTFSMKSKLSLNTAHHFQRALRIFTLNSQTHETELYTIFQLPPGSPLLLGKTWESDLIATHLNQEYLGLSPHHSHKVLPLTSTQRTGTCHQKQRGLTPPLKDKPKDTCKSNTTAV